jgi:hypothetical protein
MFRNMVDKCAEYNIQNNNCEEMVEKYLLCENPLYTFSFPISLLCGIIVFGILQAYNVSKNSYVNQLLIPIATIFIVMVLIDVISKNMVPTDIKKNLFNKCQSWKTDQFRRTIEKFQSSNLESDLGSATLPPVPTPANNDRDKIDPALPRDLAVNLPINLPVHNLNKMTKIESFQNAVEMPLDATTSMNPANLEGVKKYNGHCIQPTSNCNFCSGGEPKPANIVTAIPGPQWLPQTAESVQNNLKNGRFTQAKC